VKADIHIGVFDAVIFLGIFQGLLLAFFFLYNTRKNEKAHLYQGLFMLALTFAIAEEFMNNTGYIIRVLPISNFAEPLNLAYGPLLYLYVKRRLHPLSFNRKDQLHLILFGIYLLYMFFFFLQPEAVKYNAFVNSKHPGWPMIAVDPPFSEDPLGIRANINPLTGLHLGIYLFLTILLLRKAHKAKSPKEEKSNRTLYQLKQSTLHFIALILIFALTKIYFGRDLGDYFIATYISLMFYLTSFQIISRSSYFDRPHSFLEVPVPKYKKSSLSDNRKQQIMEKIQKEMQENRYYAHHLASLSHLSSTIKESPHHISQVINEKMNKSFFELLAHHRIEAAKEMLHQTSSPVTTIEEISEEVGYNSKSAFNKAFKKITGKTPSQFRKEKASP